jgi:hypothetical protein
MDPDEALAQLRAHYQQAFRVLDGTDEDVDPALVLSSLAESAMALDGWLSRGGFLPVPWQRVAPTLQPPAARITQGQTAREGQTR